VDRNRFKRTAVRAAAGIALLLTMMALLVFGELRRTQAETNALFSDVFGAVAHNVPDLGSGRSFRIIIMRESQAPGTRPGHEPRAQWNMLFDQKLRFPQASLITRGSFLLTNAVPIDIRLKLHLPRGAESVVMSNSELDHMSRSDFIQRFPDNQSWEIFSISQPGFNFSKTEAIFYFDHSCAGLCGGGGYILARKVDGVWRIVDQHSTWMS
jgi:hypothetical protein